MQKFDAACVPVDEFGSEVHVHISVADDEIAVPILQQAKSRGATTSCEFNGAQSEQRVQHCDICFMNHDELAGWMGRESPVEKWRAAFGRFGNWLVITQGAAGATAIHDDEIYSSPAFSTNVIDRTGGGDAFDSGYLAGVIHQMGPQRSLRAGLKLASHVIRHFGARSNEIDHDTISDIFNFGP